MAYIMPVFRDGWFDADGEGTEMYLETLSIFCDQGEGESVTENECLSIGRIDARLPEFRKRRADRVKRRLRSSLKADQSHRRFRGLRTAASTA